MTKFWNDNRGQTFVEAMLAMTIIITSVSSAMVLVQASINSSRLGGAQIVAANLAREGIEVVRSLRDSNWLQGNSFSVGMTNATAVTARPRLDPASGVWRLDFGVLTLSDPLVQIKLSPNGLYQYPDDAAVNASNTGFRRLITMGKICRHNGTTNERIESAVGGNCNVSETWIGLAATSQVQYITNNNNYASVTVEERLYDWR